MLKTTLIFATLLTATAVWADVDGIQNHPIQKMFMEDPCMSVILTIDGTESGLKNVAMMTMAFGFLMGFEADHPNIRGEHETVLMRLRADCSIDSNKTAFELLQGYTDE